MKNRFYVFVLSSALTLLAGCAPSSRSSSEAIVQRLDAQPNLGPHVVTVDVRDHVATLQGEVSSEQDRMIVYNAARTEPGIREVRDRLQVRNVYHSPMAMMSPAMIDVTDMSLQDRQILADIQRNLVPLSQSHSYRLNILVRDGYVTAFGVAGNRSDADAVLSAMRSTAGVKGVSDRIGIIPPPTDEEVRRSLQQSLASNSEFDFSGLNYEVRDGVVTFTGRVNRHQVIDAALSQALNTPGVRNIRSDVTIGR